MLDQNVPAIDRLAVGRHRDHDPVLNRDPPHSSIPRASRKHSVSTVIVYKIKHEYRISLERKRGLCCDPAASAYAASGMLQLSAAYGANSRNQIVCDPELWLYAIQTKQTEGWR
ncbi:hypothetical protein GCM10007036_07650 [Alsobacter metallidurans]|uniref:Uncharacterized protein n=1 Tax=Alsobacter metallidurans TaxID=340221 RepID=A0A917I4R3_9HYPH|nr:hypothetical protein GCM10007036_07650 [Alsobacter metallidurans]